MTNQEALEAAQAANPNFAALSADQRIAAVKAISSPDVYKVEAYLPRIGYGPTIVETFTTGYPERDVQADRLRRIQCGLPRVDYTISLLPS